MNIVTFELKIHTAIRPRHLAVLYSVPAVRISSVTRHCFIAGNPKGCIIQMRLRGTGGAQLLCLTAKQGENGLKNAPNYCKLSEQLRHCKLIIHTHTTGSSKKIVLILVTYALSEADGLCIGCLGQWAETGRVNSNMEDFFFARPCKTLD